MPERNEYAPGTPCWVDIGTDVDKAKTFYAGLFGWGSEDAGPPEETGGYGFFTKNGKLVAGYGPQQNPGPPAWASYVCVRDAAEITKRVRDAGGNVVVEPMQVMDAGTMAVFQDPQGAFISIWQPGNHKGAQLANEPGAFCWDELNARDVGKAKAFYTQVFGWGEETHEGGPMPYTEWQVGGESVAGMLPMPPGVPAQVPSHWLVYFAVDDTAAATSKVEQLGGSVQMANLPSPAGVFSVVSDPQGAFFGVIKLEPRG
jgi:predicted enzyme related to lactoylglutathione lyase